MATASAAPATLARAGQREATEAAAKPIPTASAKTTRIPNLAGARRKENTGMVLNRTV